MSVKFKISILELFKNMFHAASETWETNPIRYCYICLQRPQSGKFHVGCKKFQFGTKTGLFRLTLKKLLTSSSPSNLPKCKISGKRTKH